MNAPRKATAVPPMPQGPFEQTFRHFNWLTLALGAVYSVSGVLTGIVRLEVAGLLFFFQMFTTLVALAMAVRGKLIGGLLLSALTLMAVGVCFSFLIPSLLPALELLPIAAVAMALPYLDGRRLLVLMILGACCSGVSTLVSAYLPQALPLPGVLGPLLLVLGLIPSIWSTLSLLWTFSAQLRETLAETLVANAALRASEAQAQTQAEERALSAELGVALTRPLPLVTTLEECSRALIRHLDVRYAQLWIVEGEGGLRLWASAGQPDRVAGRTGLLPQGEGVLGRIVREQVPVVVTGLLDEPLADELAWAKDEQLSLFVGQPLVVGTRGVGVLVLLGERALTPHTLQAVTAAADAISLGIDRGLAEQDRIRLLREAQEADRRKDEFLAILAHELRNPLAPIRSAIELLRLLPPSDREAEVQRELIAREVQHMSRLLDDLFDVSRISRGQIVLRRERLDLARLLGRAVETTRPIYSQRGHFLSFDPGPLGLCVQGDAIRLLQSITNLLTNAAKYTPPHGRVWLSAHREGDEAVVQIRDTGVGLAPLMMERIFDPFVQVDSSLERANDGLGIGLTLVKRLVEMHDGKVEVESGGKNLGSTFTVRLPALPAVPAMAPAANASVPLSSKLTKVHPLNAQRVLLVDDNVNGARTLAMLVKYWGHEVRTVHDGPAALIEVNRFEPSLVILDLGLPEMDGFEVARRLRQRPQGHALRIFALSGYAQESHRTQSKEAGFDRHFVKPVDPAVLAAAIAS